MPTSDSDVDIANAALAALGEDPVLASFNPPANKTQRVVNAVYHKAKRKFLTLQAAGWHFARHRQALSRETTHDPLFGYTYSFAMPTTPPLIRPLQTDVDGEDYRIVGQHLYSHRSTCELEYVADVVVGLFSPEAQEAFVTYLAARMAYPLTKKRTIMESLREQFEKIDLPDAVLADAQAEPGAEVADDAGLVSGRW